MCGYVTEVLQLVALGFRSDGAGVPLSMKALAGSRIPEPRIPLDRAAEVVLDLARENIIGEGDAADNDMIEEREEQVSSVETIRLFFEWYISEAENEWYLACGEVPDSAEKLKDFAGWVMDKVKQQEDE